MRWVTIARTSDERCRSQTKLRFWRVLGDGVTRPLSAATITVAAALQDLSVAENFPRLLRLLQLVPGAPRFIDTEQLETILGNEGTAAARRTIQRDLVKLESMVFGLVCVDKTKPYKWRFSGRANVVLFGPGLDPQTALALRLVELHLARLLPKSTLRALQPHLAAAHKAPVGKPVAGWLDKVRLIPRSQPLDPPNVNGAIVGVVHEALLEGRQIRARYQARESDHAKEMTLNPLGLVHRDSVPYLVATVPRFTDPRLFPQHRFHDAAMIEARAVTIDGFILDDYIAAGELGFRIGERNIRLELRFLDGPAARWRRRRSTRSRPSCTSATEPSSCARRSRTRVSSGLSSLASARRWRCLGHRRCGARWQRRTLPQPQGIGVASALRSVPGARDD